MLTTLLRPRQPQRGAKLGSAARSVADSGGRWSRPPLRADAAPFDIPTAKSRTGFAGAGYVGFDGGTVINTQQPGVTFNLRWPSQANVITQQVQNRDLQARWTPPAPPPRVRSTGFLVALRVMPGRPKPAPAPPQRQYDTFYVPLVESAPPAFPTQYAGFRIETTTTVIDLCLVAIADTPTGFGQWRFQTSADTKGVYLVDTTDPNASGLRVQTAAGVKAMRKKT